MRLASYPHVFETGQEKDLAVIRRRVRSTEVAARSRCDNPSGDRRERSRSRTSGRVCRNALLERTLDPWHLHYKIIVTIERLGLRGEVIVADNGSTDGSQAIAAALGARVISIEARGYGSALGGGIAASRGESS